jgi:hypothetical protein
VLPPVRFEWDPAKAEANARNHKLTFEEARQLFTSGADYLFLFDAAHSCDEDRFICIGPIERGVVLVVMTERKEDVIQIISARFATKRECSLYEKRMRGKL